MTDLFFQLVDVLTPLPKESVQTLSLLLFFSLQGFLPWFLILPVLVVLVELEVISEMWMA